jgi:hypothetical protein
MMKITAMPIRPIMLFSCCLPDWVRPVATLTEPG